MKTVANVSGMSCAHCVRAVFTALSGVPGITRADVSIGRAVVEHDQPVSEQAIREAVSVAGYEVTDFSHDDRRTLPVIV